MSSNKFDVGQLKGAYSAGYEVGYQDGLRDKFINKMVSEWEPIKFSGELGVGDFVKANSPTYGGWMGFAVVQSVDRGLLALQKMEERLIDGVLQLLPTGNSINDIAFLMYYEVSKKRII